MIIFKSIENPFAANVSLNVNANSEPSMIQLLFQIIENRELCLYYSKIVAVVLQLYCNFFANKAILMFDNIHNETTGI